MRISVVIPVRNEAANLGRVLDGLARQEFDPNDYEVIVVDGSSADGTADVARSFAGRIRRLHVLDNPQRLSSAARNLGVRRATGEYVVVVDGHCAIPDGKFLANVAAAFATSGADTLGRPQPLNAERPTAFQRAVSAARRSWLGHNPDSAIFSDKPRFVPPDNVAVAYRRNVFDKVGLFDERFDACEDVEFNTRVSRAGLTCYFTPAIAVEYQPRSSVGGLFRQMARYGTGRMRLARKHPSSMTLASLVPPLWLTWLVVAFAAALAVPAFEIVFLASVLIYGTVVFAESVRSAVRVPATAAFRLPAAFAAIHAGFAWGYLRELLAPRRQFAAPPTAVALPNRRAA